MPETNRLGHRFGADRGTESPDRPAGDWQAGAAGSALAMGGLLLMNFATDTVESAPRLFGAAFTLLGFILLGNCFIHR